jgi:hypothetical protein
MARETRGFIYLFHNIKDGSTLKVGFQPLSEQNITQEVGVLLAGNPLDLMSFLGCENCKL